MHLVTHALINHIFVHVFTPAQSSLCLSSNEDTVVITPLALVFREWREPDARQFVFNELEHIRPSHKET